MKKVLVSLLLVAAVGHTASNFNDCRRNVEDACAKKGLYSRGAAIMAEVQNKFQGKAKCEQVNPVSGGDIRTTFVGIGTQSIVTVNTQFSSPEACTYRVVKTESPIKEFREAGGRLFVLLADGKVAVVLTNNFVQYLVNTNNTENLGVPYYGVTDINPINATTMELIYGSKRDSVNMAEMYDGLNKYRVCLVGGCKRH